MSILDSLNREQKEAIGLLQIGTFLEYFDLMLYIHMAVLLNEVFFPKTSPHTASLLAALAFCSTYILQPFGALIFGFIGDHIGRKNTVVITSMMMAVSCIVMASLPTYAEIGIKASFVVTICRIMQGLSSLGESIGAEIYLAEITKPPLRYPVVTSVAAASAFGSMFALVIATLVINSHADWRAAFWIGSIIAVIGTLARTRLRETPDFVDMKRRMKKIIEEAEQDGVQKVAAILKSHSPVWREKVSWKTTASFFLIYCSWPVFFYFSFIYSGGILQKKFHYAAQQVIQHNLIVSIWALLSVVACAVLSYKIHPLKILKWKIIIFTPFVLLVPYLLTRCDNAFNLMLIQSFCVLFVPTNVPANAILLTHFPVFRRFTYTSLLYAISRVMVYIAISFGLVYLDEIFGAWGLWFIMIPTVIGCALGVYHFFRLEDESNPDLKRYSIRAQMQQNERAVTA